jgi:hypothetical protein
VRVNYVLANIVVVEKQYVLHINECVFVALSTQHAKRMGRIVIQGLSVSTVFFHIIS